MVSGYDRLHAATSLKRSAYYALEQPLKGGPVSRFFAILILVLIAVNAVLVFVGSEPGIHGSIRGSLTLIGSVSTICFGAEYLIRLWIADLVYEETPAKARLRYVFSLMGLIDLLAFAPGILAFFLPLPSQLLNAARIIRLIRFMKLTRYMKGLHSIGRVFEKRRHEITAAFIVLGLLTITASVIMFALENPVQPDKFDSVFTGMYWAMTTITTTGYGDIVPITGPGRFIGFVTMLLAIGAVAIPAGIFSAGFVAEFRNDDVRSKVHGLYGAEGGTRGDREQ